METDEQKALRKARKKRYESSPKGLARARARAAATRAADPEATRAAVRKYQSTPEFKKWRRAYKATEEQKAARRAYRKKPHVRAREKAYARGFQLRYRYRVTAEEYASMVESQGGRCAICKEFPSGRTRSGDPAPLVVDHCHATGEVRGLLCRTCNTALGMLKDSPDLAFQAASYLSRPMAALSLLSSDKRN